MGAGAGAEPVCAWTAVVISKALAVIAAFRVKTEPVVFMMKTPSLVETQISSLCSATYRDEY
jgi:hypothetical protein